MVTRPYQDVTVLHGHIGKITTSKTLTQQKRLRTKICFLLPQQHWNAEKMKHKQEGGPISLPVSY